MDVFDFFEKMPPIACETVQLIRENKIHAMRPSHVFAMHKFRLMKLVRKSTRDLEKRNVKSRMKFTFDEWIHLVDRFYQNHLNLGCIHSILKEIQIIVNAILVLNGYHPCDTAGFLFFYTHLSKLRVLKSSSTYTECVVCYDKCATVTNPCAHPLCVQCKSSLARMGTLKHCPYCKTLLHNIDDVLESLLKVHC